MLSASWKGWQNLKNTIDDLSTATGWTPGSGSGISASVNGVPEFIAGLNIPGSLILTIPAGNLNKTIAKSYNIDLTGYNELVFHIWSREKQNHGDEYRLASEYAYKIDLQKITVVHAVPHVTHNYFYIPTFKGFNDVTLYIPQVGQLDNIEITALHNDEDYLILSNMVAVKDELPVDIFRGVKGQLAYEMNNKYASSTGGVNGKGILLGKVSASAGDTTIYNIDSYGYLERYAVIMIDDGAGNTETHQLDNNDGQEYSFSSLYDGTVLLNDYTDASLYLLCPVEYGTAEREIILPGVSVWGMAPEEVLRTNKIEEMRDTFQPGDTVQSRLTPVTFQYIIILDCEARNNELLALMSLACRSMIGKQYIWVNGKKLNLYVEGSGEYIEPVEGYNEIPKIQYRTRVEVKEDIYDRSALVNTITNNLNVNLQ